MVVVRKIALDMKGFLVHSFNGVVQGIDLEVGKIKSWIN